MANCPTCMAPLKEGAKVCSVCGSKIKVKNIDCPNCGNTMPEGTPKCGVCGTDMTKLKEAEEIKKEPEVKQEEAADTTVQEEKKTSSGQMDSTGEADLSILDDMLPDDDKNKKPDYPTMDAVEMPGQEKPKPKKQREEIPIPLPSVVGAEPKAGGQNAPAYNGAPVQQASQNLNQAPNANSRQLNAGQFNSSVGVTAGKSGIKAFMPILIILVVLVVALGCIFIFKGMDSYEKPLKNAVKVFQNGDGEALKDMFITKYQKEIKDKEQKQLDATAKLMNTVFEAYYGDGFKVTYKINDKEKLSDDDYEALTEMLGADADSKISDAYKLKVTFTLKGDNAEDSNDSELIVIKYDGKWGIAADPNQNNMSSLLGSKANTESNGE